MDSRLRILHIEDNRYDYELIHDYLQSEGLEYDVTWIRNKNEFLAISREINSFNLILADYTIDGFYGDEALKIIRMDHPDLPVIFITGTIGEEKAIELMKNGANDYLLKTRIKMLPLAINRSLEEYEQKKVRKKVEADLILMKNQLNAFFKGASVGLCLLDRNLRYIAVNDILADLNGKLIHEHIGKTIYDVIPYIAPIIETGIREVLRSGKALLNQEVSNSSSYSGWKGNHWMISYFPVPGDDGIPENIGCIVVDVTDKVNAQNEIVLLNQELEERVARRTEELNNSKLEIEQDSIRLKLLNEKLIEREKELKQANDAKDKFFSIISHDLKGLITSELLTSDFAVQEFEKLDKPALKNLLQQINKIVRSINSLLSNLLEWASSQMGKLEYEPYEFELHYVVEHIVKLLSGKAEIKDISILNTIPNNLKIYADRHMISTVMRNLIENSIKFTPEGGKIEINSEVDDSHVIISVADTGVGMDVESLNRIFRIDSKHTTPGTNNEIGTGLGLILCKEFILRHKGEIYVESKENEGSRFFIKLPAHIN